MGSRLEKTSSEVRKRIEQHTFDDEEGEEYEPSKFGGFPEYFRRKKIKLQNRDAARRIASDKPAILKGIVVHVNGYTQPSLNDIHNMVIDYGGGFVQYLDGKTMVTHIIASNLTPRKKIEFRKYRIVKPAWIVDSITAGKLLPWENYRVVDEGIRQNLLKVQEGRMTSQANEVRAGYKEQSETSWYADQLKKSVEELDRKSQSSLSISQLREPPAFSSTPIKHSTQDDEISDVGNVSSQQDQKNQMSFNYGSFDEDLPEEIENELLIIDPVQRDITKDEDMNEEMLAQGRTSEESHSYGRTPNDPPSPAKMSELEIKENDVMAVDSDLLPSNLILKNDLQKFGGRILTAEEHNAILLSDPRRWKSSTVNPGFLKQYYEESRLHHLSAWKAELRSKIQAHTRELTASQQARQKRPPGSRRYIFHVDFDSFFVAVSLLKHPELVNKPVVVAHGDGSGSEIASCNYPAREFGVKNGMWMKNALELCPDLKVLPYEFKAYEEASKEFYEAIIETGGLIQSVSVDEALIDLSNVCAKSNIHNGSNGVEDDISREEASALEIASGLRAKIKERTSCEVSVGIGGNILLAKIALRKAKPAGQHLITPDAILASIGDLDVQDLPGVAYSMGAKLEEIGIKYVKDIREVSKDRLITTLGPKTGEKLWEYARGIDKMEVGDQVVRKSVSAEVSWGVRFVTQEQVDDFIRCLCEELERRLQNEDVKGRQLTVKIMRKSVDSPRDPPKHMGHGKCDVFNKSVGLGLPTTDMKIIAREALSILKGYGFSPGELRGIGIQMTKLEPNKPAIMGGNVGQRPLEFKTAPKVELGRSEDPDEVETPKKPLKFVKHPAAVLATSDHESKSTALLNTAGTQFLLPTQVDPSILAELPHDVRSKLIRTNDTSRASKKQPKLGFQPRNESPSRLVQENTVPSASQIDPEVLAVLPEDLRAEVLEYYQQSPQKAVKQTLLPQSPHKDRAIKLVNKTTPTKSRGSALSRVRGRLKDSKSTLFQANFAKINESRQAKEPEREAAALNDEGISEEFLAALPEDIREEILDQQRRERLKRKGGLEMGASKKRPKIQSVQPQRFIEIPARAPRPEFTSRKLTSLSELRAAITEWCEDCKYEEPNLQDVETLCNYLRRVALEERDLSKVVGTVKWLLWMVQQDDRSANAWQKATTMAKNAVQASVKARGLGPVSFD